LTLCWAAWDPANALVQLDKDFTAQSGINMKYEFVPWTSYADRFINELNSHGKLCDLIIGDSQWIGGSAENGHYVKLNDFFDKNHISMNDFMPATVLGYSEWPKNTPNYWALPAMADAVGWTYRKDWFAKPELRAEFKKKYGRELEPPKTWDQLKDIAEFFQNRTIDGKKVYGAYIFTERGSEGITMGVTNAMYDWGFEYNNPKKPYDMQGFVNSKDAVKGLEFYKALYKCCTAPGMTNAYMTEGLDAFKSGQVAMQMNWFAFFPGLYKDPNVGGAKIGFFPNPSEKQHWTQLGGQGISVVSYSEHRDVTASRMKAWGIYQETYDSGDKIIYAYELSVGMKDGAMQSGKGTYQATGGTGKMKGIKAKGTCTYTPGADNGTDYSCTGVYTLAGSAKSAM